MNRCVRLELSSLLLLALFGSALPPAHAARNRHLARAKQAYADLDYGKVLPLLKKALAIARSDEEEVDIYELMAIIHATYNRDAKAQAAFIEVVKRRPDYALPPDTSPKIRSALQRARAEYEVLAGKSIEVEPHGVVHVTDTGEPEMDEASEVQATEPGAMDADLPLLPPDRSRDAFYTTWWFWTIVGGAILAGAAGYGIYAASHRQPPPYDLGPVPLK